MSSSSGADPEGTVLSGDTARPYLTEGVGEDFFPGTYDPAVVDRWVRVSDRDAFAMARRLTREEGILAGELVRHGARGGAARCVRELTGVERRAPSAVVVVLLPDGGRSYLSKIYNDEWMRGERAAGDDRAAIVRDRGAAAGRHHDPERPPVVIVARTTERVGDGHRASSRLRHQPDAGVGGRRGRRRGRGIVGRSARRACSTGPIRDPSVVERTVGEVMDRPLPLVDASATLDEAFAPAVRRRRGALVAVRGERPAGVVTKLDLLEYLAHRPATNTDDPSVIARPCAGARPLCGLRRRTHWVHVGRGRGAPVGLRPGRGSRSAPARLRPRPATLPRDADLGRERDLVRLEQGEVDRAALAPGLEHRVDAVRTATAGDA